MPGSGKDRLAALVVDQHGAFEEALAGSRQRSPTREFRSFAAAIRQYVDSTREDEMLHRGVVRAVNGLVEYLRSERKRGPGRGLARSGKTGMFALSRLRSALRRRRASWSVTWPANTSASLSLPSLA